MDAATTETNATNLNRAISTDARFNLSDFHRRWKSARATSIPGGKLCIENGADEPSLILSVSIEKREETLKAVFDQSRKLGQSLSKYLGLVFEASDLRHLLSDSQAPGCFSGEWRFRSGTPSLLRSGCARPTEADSFYCDYFREALDGLVMGVTEDLRFARYQSCGHGDIECQDILFSDEDRHLAWFPVPENIRDSLASIRNGLLSSKIELTLLGLNEGVLYYKMESPTGPPCGIGGKIVHEGFARDVVALYPLLKVKDVSPLAVLGNGS